MYLNVIFVMQIVLYQPNKGKGVPAGPEPPALPLQGADAIFSYENIPEKHFKKYSYASKFVDLVKSKTPKITYYSTLAKCFLMENDPEPDFEACYYEGDLVCGGQKYLGRSYFLLNGLVLLFLGGKVSKTQVNVKIVENSGTCHSFNSEEVPHLSSSALFMWEHFKKCYAHCQRVAVTMEALMGTTEETCFPVVIGRRPPSATKPLSSSSGNKENMSPQSVAQVPTVSFNV